MVPMSVESIEERAEVNPKRSGWIWGVLIVGFVLFSSAPTLYELSRAGDLQPDRQFELVHNFYTDYNFYLSRIREGLEGRWTVVERYTSEPHTGSFIHELYVLMGEIGRMVRVPQGRSGDVYHMARIVFALTLLSLIAYMCRFAWGDTEAKKRTGRTWWAVLSFLLAVSASSWPKLVFVDGLPRFGGYMSWWSVMDSLQRITFLPHLLLGQALLIWLVIVMTDSSFVRKTPNIVFLGMLTFLLGMVFPPGYIFLAGVIGVVGIMWFLWDRKTFRYVVPGWISIMLMGLPALLYLSLMTSIYPWKRLTELDTLHPLPFDYMEYALAMGPLLPLGLIGLIVSVYRKEKSMLPYVGWVFAWLAFLGIFHFVPQQSPLRFSEMIPHVPLGILTAYLFYILYRSRIFRSVIFVPVILVCVGVGQMYSSWAWQRDFIDHKIRATLPLVPTGSYVMYPLRDFATGIGYLGDATKRTDIILSETTAGNYIPAYIGNTVYIGHDNTVNAEEKKALVSAFYSGRMTSVEAQEWLTGAHIRMIYFGPQEREEAYGKDLTAYYPFLSAQYTNSSVIIYAPLP